MKFSAIKEEILPHIQNAASFISTKNINTLLQNILMTIEKNTLTIKATNYQVGYCSAIEVDAEKTGSLTVNGKTISELIKKFPKGSLINFNFDGSMLNISSGNMINYELATIEPEGFPTISEILPDYFFKINAENLLKCLKKIVFCILNDSPKIEYTGAQFIINGNVLETYATSSTRVAVSKTEIDSEYATELIINIPKKTISEIIRIFNQNDEIEVGTDKKQIYFKQNGITIYSKLIEKHLKAVARFFNSEFPIYAQINKKEFIDVSDRVSTLSSEETPGLILSFDKDSVNISSIKTEYGSGSELINNITFNGEKFSIYLNAKSLLEILNNIDENEFSLEITNKNSPVIIRPKNPDNSSYSYLLAAIEIGRMS